MLKHYLQLLMDRTHLTQDEAEAALTIILEETEPHQTAAFLAILKYRHVTPQEVAGMVAALEKKGVHAKLPYPSLDIVGTGGDLAQTVNISTGASILAAACGIPIAKIGNRSVSSRSGSADVLEALGIDIEIPPEQLEECLRQAGITFMFAPFYHPSLKRLSPIRKALRLPTVFNILGPLINPARTDYALIGAANLTTLELMSQTILHLNNKKRVLVFHGSGLDELTTLGKVIAYDVQGGQRKYLEIDPSSLGFSPCSLKDLQGGDPLLNATILKEVFSGQKGAVADALIFNAGAAVWIFGQASTLAEGIEVARDVLDKGGALRVLDKWISTSEKLKKARSP